MLLGLWPARSLLHLVPAAQAHGHSFPGKRWQAGNGGPLPVSRPQAPLSLRCQSVVSQAVQVEGTVNGKPHFLTVDSGAARTFVSTDVMAAQDFPLAAQQLCGVAGHCTRLRGPVEARIGIGSKEEEMPVYVAGIDDPCLLGLDYLKMNGACLDFGDMTMSVHGEKMPLLESGECAEVVAATVVRIPPWSEARVPCRIGRMRQDGGLVEPSLCRPLSEGLAVGRTLTPPDEREVLVLIANLSDREQRIPKGTVMGSCEEVERVRAGPNVVRQAQCTDGDVPAYLRDLLSRSATRLDHRQAACLAELLCSYADVFSSGDFAWGAPTS